MSCVAQLGATVPTSSVRLPRRRTWLIGAASAAGAPQPGCELGPSRLQQARLASELAGVGIDTQWHAVMQDRGGSDALQRVAALCANLAGETAMLSAAGEFFAVLGGDHSCAIGTWSGVSRGLRHRGPLGLVWLDAHLDSHVPHTSPSGAIHGMPLACLLGYGSDELTGIAGFRPALQPRHVCVVGPHSFEREEAALLEQVGVRVFTNTDIRRRGLASVLNNALDIASAGSAGIGISIDLDVIDPNDAPGVSVPEPGGLSAGDLIDALVWVSRSKQVRGIEIAEYNPLHDEGSRTARVVGKLLTAAIPLAP